MTLVRLAARPLLASMFVVGGLDAIRNAGKKVDAAEPVTDRLAPLLQKVVPQLPDDPQQLVRINGAAQVGAGLLLATGRLPRLSGAVLAATLVPTTRGRPPLLGGDRTRQKKAQQRIHFFKNASMLGGLLLAAVDTEGKPGVAWRARRAAADVRREAKGLARSARREAKLARRAADLSPGSGPSLAWGRDVGASRLSRRAVVVGALGGLAACSCRGLRTADPDDLGHCQRQRDGHALRHGHVHAGDRTDEGRLAAAGQVGTRHARAPVRPDYDQVRLLENPRYDGQRPLAVLSVQSAQDVATGLAFAQDHAVPVAVRSGGHSYPGWSGGGTPRALVIDCRPMNASRPAAPPPRSAPAPPWPRCTPP